MVPPLHRLRAPVLCEQLAHRLKIARRPNVTVQVIPAAAGAHIGEPASRLDVQAERRALRCSGRGVRLCRTRTTGR
ncbi:Scr1 family TA system antitoxin-like transcriptional regulator [Actinoallomurus liliacearum]|uniref:Scr1 family TA system antitoxin-like transcriptional regulator n=1 Tax=Actinoallomurus liliacearum TaxID=1080073 RepID=UPI003CD06193